MSEYDTASMSAAGTGVAVTKVVSMKTVTPLMMGLHVIIVTSLFCKRGGLVSPMWDQCGIAPSTALNCASPLTGKAAKWVSTGRTLWQQSAAHV